MARSKSNLTFTDFAGEIKSGKLQNVYFIAAYDNYFPGKAAELLREKISGSKDNRDNFFLQYGDETSAEEIVDLCSNFSSLFSSNKIVIVKRCEKFGKKLDLILTYTQKPDADTTLLLIFDKDYVIEKKLDKEYSFYDFASLPDEEYMRWVKSLFNAKDCLIDDAELDLFVESVPKIFDLVENEVTKIAGYCEEISQGGNKKVTKDVIYKFIGYDTSYSPYELMASIISKNSKKSIEILDNMINKSGINEIYLLTLITGYYMDIMSAKTKGFDSANINEIYSKYKLWGDRIDFVKKYKNLVNENDFGQIFEKILNIDQKIKTSMLDSKVLLTSLVEELSNI